uniref:X8 domain-containing protein n=1 Tax=Leersia perrieri TaxID=77586 RepID=A0A0D9XIT5_9ORYZ
MEFLVLLLVSNSLLLPSLGLAVSGQEAHEVAMAHLHEQPSPPAGELRVSVAQADLPMVASSVLGAESWLRAHVLAHYPSKPIAAIAVAHSFPCSGAGAGNGLLSLRVSRAVKNLHHALLRWGLAGEIKIDASIAASCAKKGEEGALKRRLYGMHHLPPPQPPAMTFSAPPPPGVPLSFAPNSPPEVVPSIPPAPAVALPPASPPMSMPATPPEAAAGGIAPCSAPPVTAMSPPPWSGEGGNGGLWCVAKPTVPLDRLQEAMDYACSQAGVDCEVISGGGSCFYPDSVAAHASYAFNSYWQKMRHVGGSCSFGGAAVLINSDPSMINFPLPVVHWLSPVSFHVGLKKAEFGSSVLVLAWRTKVWINPYNASVINPSFFLSHPGPLLGHCVAQ